MHTPISRSTPSDRIHPEAGSAAAGISSCLPRCAILGIAGMLASLLSAPLAATEFTVGRTDDPDPPLLCAGTFPCSLRDAILAANANPGSDTIVIPRGVYVLSIAGRDEDVNLQGDIDVTDTVTITGTGAATTTIDAAGIDRVFDVRSGTLVLQYVRVTGGYALDVGGGPQTDEGGGLRMRPGGGLFLNEVEVVGNRAAAGGGIDAACCGPLVIAGSTIGSNVATRGAGGLDNSTTLTVADTTFEGNTTPSDGGGVATGAGSADVLFQNTTFSGNSADYGGGLYIVGGTARCIHCTFSDNSANIEGDAIDNNNSGVELTSSLIDGSCGADGAATFVSHGGNLEGPGNTCSLDPGGATPDLVSVSYRGLKPLAGYGGPTRTHALRSDSPAIGAANQSSCLPTDQRRATRVGSCDTGAYEYGAVPPGPSLFADGFDSGGTAAWSAAVP